MGIRDKDCNNIQFMHTAYLASNAIGMVTTAVA